MISVHYYAILKDLCGCATDEFDVSDSCDGHELLELVGKRHVNARPILSYVRLATNDAYLSDDYIFEKGSTVLLIPPVSGG